MEPNTKAKPRPTRPKIKLSQIVLSLIFIGILGGATQSYVGHIIKHQHELREQVRLLAIEETKLAVYKEAYDKGLMVVDPKTITPGATPSFVWADPLAISEAVIQSQIDQIEKDPLPLPKK